jgi:hypothetical protein
MLPRRRSLRGLIKAPFRNVIPRLDERRDFT